jgi:hypothetical protein
VLTEWHSGHCQWRTLAVTICSTTLNTKWLLCGLVPTIPTMDRFHVRGEAADSVAEYLRYHQIVGDADGGIPFTDTEFAVSQRMI